MQSRLEELALPLRVVTAEPVLALARSAGVQDVLVLRRAGSDSFALSGGLGAGAAWAGDVTLATAAAAPLRAAAERGELTRWAGDAEQHVLGPYYARHAVLLPVDHSNVVLLGGPAPLTDDPLLQRIAAGAVAHVGAVAPAKRLADELEVLTAVRDVMHCTAIDVRSTLTHVASSAAAALGCEVAILWLPGESELVVVERGWRLDASRDELVAALQQVRQLPLPLCAQDSATDPLPGPLGPTRGARSHLVLPIGAPGAGVLVLMHTAVAPRGFTDLCRTVASKVVEAGSVVVQSSVLRAELQRLLQHAEAVARRDALTGLSNRLAWDESLATVGARVDAGECASVVIVDLNHLKTVNDEHGHDAGDRLLQRAADALSSIARRGDTVARLGGDEFGLLLPGVDALDAARVVERLREAFARTAPVGATALSAAFGTATCDPGGSLRSAAYRADSAMYVDKQAARGRR